MDIKVIILRDGTISVLAEGEGDYESAKKEVLSAIEKLKAADIPLDQVSEVERHRHTETETVQQGIRQKA